MSQDSAQPVASFPQPSSSSGENAADSVEQNLPRLDLQQVDLDIDMSRPRDDAPLPNPPSMMNKKDRTLVELLNMMDEYASVVSEASETCTRPS